MTDKAILVEQDKDRLQHALRRIKSIACSNDPDRQVLLNIFVIADDALRAMLT